jgi:hypothetical protein
VQAAEAASGGRSSAAHPVVFDRQYEVVVGRRGYNARGFCVRVLGHVCQRFGDDEVGRGLDRWRIAIIWDLESDWQRHAVGERLDGGLKATVGEDGGMDAACELAELSDGGAYPFDAFGDDGGTFTASLRELQCHDGFH